MASFPCERDTLRGHPQQRVCLARPKPFLLTRRSTVAIVINFFVWSSLLIHNVNHPSTQVAIYNPSFRGPQEPGTPLFYNLTFVLTDAPTPSRYTTLCDRYNRQCSRA